MVMMVLIEFKETVIDITNYNVLIDGRNFYDQLITD